MLTYLLASFENDCLGIADTTGYGSIVTNRLNTVFWSYMDGTIEKSGSESKKEEKFSKWRNKLVSVILAVLAPEYQ